MSLLSVDNCWCKYMTTCCHIALLFVARFIYIMFSLKSFFFFFRHSACGRGAEICDVCVCLSVCLSVCMYVCLSTHCRITCRLHQIFDALSVSVAHHSSGSIVICSVVLVLLVAFFRNGLYHGAVALWHSDGWAQVRTVTVVNAGLWIAHTWVVFLRTIFEKSTPPWTLLGTFVPWLTCPCYFKILGMPLLWRHFITIAATWLQGRV